MTGLFLAACGDDSSTTASGGSGGTGGAGGSGGSTTTTTVTTTTVTTTTTTGSGGSIPGCAGGVDLEFGALIEGNLQTTGQEDYYKFQGTKGQVLWFDIDAQDADSVSFDPSYIDTFVTLFDANEKRIAQNNNPSEFSTADSRLYTILPADGEYCIRVAECWTVANNPASECLAPKDKDNTFYQMLAFELVDETPSDSYTADLETGNDAASALPLEYISNPDGGYYGATAWGYYENTTDVDVFSFTLPIDSDVSIGARAHVSINAFLPGVSGSGSTIPTGELVVVDPAQPDVPYARLDPSKSDNLGAPLELDKEYLLFVNRPQGMQEANDFYILTSYPTSGNPLETADLTNDLPATPELIDLANETSAFVEGDLLPITDLDHYKVDVPAGTATVTAVCSARTRGSGLRGLKISVLGDNGMLLAAGATDIETASQIALVSDVPVGGNGSVVLKVEAASQATDASSTYYLCGVHFTAN